MIAISCNNKVHNYHTIINKKVPIFGNSHDHIISKKLYILEING